MGCVPAQGGEEEIVTWVTDAVTGAPRPNTEVLVRLDARQRSKGDTRWESTTHRLRSGADGVARWRYPSGFHPRVVPSRSLSVTAAAEGNHHAAVVHASWVGPDSDRTPRWTYYLETDRPASITILTKSRRTLFNTSRVSGHSPQAIARRIDSRRVAGRNTYGCPSGHSA